ncbi:cytokine-dependent hematopoietic cell linker [Aulostomus maculatus]
MKRKQRLCHDSSIVEPKYDIVGDHEDNEVRILPARPLNDPGVYADEQLRPKQPADQTFSITAIVCLGVSESVSWSDSEGSLLERICCEADWYVGDFNRVDAEHALHLVNKDGAFLVRNCSVNTSSEPLVLAVYHERKVYNVKIRFIKSVNKYVLGTTGQRSNDMFDSVADIIRFYSMFPITLISGKNTAGSQDPENCILMCPVTKRDVELLLQ